VSLSHSPVGERASAASERGVRVTPLRFVNLPHPDIIIIIIIIIALEGY